MSTKTSINTSLYRATAIFVIVMMLLAAFPVTPAGATSLNITSLTTGTWEATAWPSTLRSGTISVTAGNSTVTGAGTAFLTELSVGNIIKTTGDIQIGTVASITSNTSLTLTNIPATNRTNIAYNVQGVGPADNVTIANGHNVTIAAKAVNQTGTVTVNPGGTLTISDAGAVFSILSVNGTVNATMGNAFGALTINNGGVVNAGTNGSYTASSLTINTGGTMNIARALTVSGATSISGTISFSSTSVTARLMTFTGPVTLNAGSTWIEPAGGNGANNSYDFQNNFTNNASTFTASPTSTHTFSGAGRVISGATNTSIARVSIPGTYTNNGTLTVGTALSGTGALTNASTLNLGGTSSISTLANAGTFTKTGAGPISTALANFTNTGTVNLNGTGTITGITNDAGGTVNLASSGTITAFNNATATSTLNISDLTPPTITTLTVSAAGNTVNYNGAGNQTVKALIYSNLVFSGSGAKSITMPNGSTLTTGNLSIAPTGTATASITGPNLVVNSLSLGGFGKTSGTWGSTSSAAANTDNNFFALTTGYLNVTTDTRLAQTINFTSTAPFSGVVGGKTYTPTANATSGLAVVLTIDATSSSVCSMNAGVVSFNAPGTCLINGNQAGNANYMAAPQAQQSITVTTPTYWLPWYNNVDLNTQLRIGNISETTATVHIFIGGTEVTPVSGITLLAGASTRVSYEAVNNGPVEVVSNVPIVAAERVIYKVNGTATSFSEMMGLPDSQLDNSYWLPWYNNVDLDTQLRIGNVSGSTATVNIFIGGAEVTPVSGITLLAGESTRVSYEGVDDGPVEVVSNVPIVVAERVIYIVDDTPTSFSEMKALSQEELSTSYWLPWYNNVNLNTQLRIG